MLNSLEMLSKGLVGFFFRNGTKFVKYAVKPCFSNNLNSVLSTGKIFGANFLYISKVCS